jgi:hypothetical protein
MPTSTGRDALPVKPARVGRLRRDSFSNELAPWPQVHPCWLRAVPCWDWQATVPRSTSQTPMLVSCSTSGTGVLASYRASVSTALPRPAAPPPSSQTLALSPDEGTLYFVDCVHGGLTVLDASTLVYQSSILTGLPLRAVWAAPEGTHVFLQSLDGWTMYVSEHGTCVTGMVHLSAQLTTFVSPRQLVV